MPVLAGAKSDLRLPAQSAKTNKNRDLCTKSCSGAYAKGISSYKYNSKSDHLHFICAVAAHSLGVLQDVLITKPATEKVPLNLI